MCTCKVIWASADYISTKKLTPSLQTPIPAVQVDSIYQAFLAIETGNGLFSVAKLVGAVGIQRKPHRKIARVEVVAIGIFAGIAVDEPAEFEVVYAPPEVVELGFGVVASSRVKVRLSVGGGLRR